MLQNTKTVVIVSLKKPILEPRMKKLAFSLQPAYKVLLIGSHSNNTTSADFVTLPHSSLNIFSILLEVAVKLIKNKPDLLIVQHPLLLIFSPFFRCMYDVQENYRLNFLHNPAYKSPQKYLLAFGVAALEWMYQPFVCKFILAEKVYARQLKFKNAFVLENKFLGGLPDCQVPERLKFLVCGTISRLFGVERAVLFFERVHQLLPESELEVCGHLVEPALGKWLEDRAQRNPAIKLCLSTAPVEHELLLRKMAACSFVVLAHAPNPCIEGKIPTKVYECLALRKPMIAQIGHEFSDLIVSCDAGFVLDFENISEDIFPKLFLDYYRKPLSINPFWQRDEFWKVVN